VVVIGDVPQRSGQPVDCLLRSHATPASCADTLTTPEADVTQQVAQLAQDEHVGFIDTTGWFCYESDCPLVIGNLVAYRDDNHVGYTYSSALSQAFRGALNTLIGPR
jgi:hypothetical protein